MAVRIPQPKLGQLEVEGVRTRGFGVNATADQLGGEQARTIAGLGQSIGQAAEVSGNIAHDQARLAEQAKKRDELIAVNKQGLELELELDQELVAAQDSAGPGAVDFAKGRMEAFKKRRDEILSTSQLGPEAKAQLEADLMRAEGRLYGAATTYERNARRAHNVSQIEGALGQAQSLVYQDPTRLDEMVERQLATVAGANLSSEDRTKLEGAVRSSLAAAAWEKRVELDPRGTLAAMRGEGDVPGLEVADRIRLGGKAEAEVHRQENEAERLQAKAEAEAEKARVKAQRALALRLEDETAAAARGETIDPGIDRRILETYDPDEAGLLLERLNLQRRVGTATVELGTMTNEQIAATVEKLAPAGQGYEAEAKGQDAVRTAAAAVLKARRDDPAAEVARAYPDVAELLNSNDPADVAEGARLSASHQRATFGFQPDQVRLLPKDVATRKAEQFKNARTVDERLAIITPLTLDLKDDTSADSVLDQLDLDPGVALAVKRLRAGDETGARAIMGSLTVDLKDMPKLGADAEKDVSIAADALFAGDGPAGAAAAASALTQEPGMLRAVGQQRGVLERMTKLYAAQGMGAEEAAERASKEVFGGTEALVDEDLGAVVVPDGMYAPAFEQTLIGARANLTLPFAAPDEPMKRREQEAYLVDLRENGRWVNSGGGFVLLNRQGRPTPGPDGKPRVFTAGELMAMQGTATDTAPYLGTGM